MSEAPVQPETKVAFISGPINTGPDAAYFHTHYKAEIDIAIAAGHAFVIGPITTGVDADALSYLQGYPILPSRITIFLTPSEDRAWGDEFRSRNVNVHVLEDITATSQNRDAAMTAASDYDILRWRTEDEAREVYGNQYRAGHVTNTERNWRRRRGISFAAKLGDKDYVRYSNEGVGENRESGGGKRDGSLRWIKDKFGLGRQA